MISGAMLLDYRERQTTIIFLKKRFLRVVVPLLSWSIIWYIFDIFWSANPGPMRHPNPGIVDFIKGLLLNNINNIFWFFYVILALYIVTPIFSELAISKKYNLMFSVVCVYFVINCVLIYFTQILKISIDLSNVAQPLLSSSYLGYFLMGYLIHKNYFSDLQEKIFIVLGALAFAGVLTIALFMPSLKTTSTTGLAVFLYSVGLFIIIKRISKMIVFNEKTMKKIAMIASTNLGVYLIHPFFIKLLDKILDINQNNWFHIYLFPFIIYFICVVFTLVCKKLPVIKNIFP